METINSIELKDENVYPDETVLRKILGKSYKSYAKLLEIFDGDQMTREWRYYRDGKAWLCKVQKKKRTISWMSAWKGFMKATIYFPEKYLDKVLASGISEQMVQKIMATKNVGKSKPCIFEIRDDDILDDFEKTMKLKLQCK